MCESGSRCRPHRPWFDPQSVSLWEPGGGRTFIAQPAPPGQGNTARKAWFHHRENTCKLNMVLMHARALLTTALEGGTIFIPDRQMRKWRLSQIP